MKTSLRQLVLASAVLADTALAPQDQLEFAVDAVQEMLVVAVDEIAQLAHRKTLRPAEQIGEFITSAITERDRTGIDPDSLEKRGNLLQPRFERVLTMLQGEEEDQQVCILIHAHLEDELDVLREGQGAEEGHPVRRGVMPGRRQLIVAEIGGRIVPVLGGLGSGSYKCSNAAETPGGKGPLATTSATVPK